MFKILAALVILDIIVALFYFFVLRHKENAKTFAKILGYGVIFSTVTIAILGFIVLVF